VRLQQLAEVPELEAVRFVAADLMQISEDILQAPIWLQILSDVAIPISRQESNGSK